MTKAVLRLLSPVLSVLVLSVLFVSPLSGSPPQQDDGTALYEAAVNEQPDLVRSRLEQGADPDSRGPDGMPVLVEAVSRVRFCYENAECIDESMSISRLLLEYGADANVASDDGFTAVMVAWRSPEALDLLIENGADVNAQDAEGRTVLMRAAASRSYTPGTPSVSMYRGKVNALLEHGADPSIRDVIGRTALEYAERRGRSEAVSLLPWTDEATLREAVAACRFCADRPPASVDSLSDILERGADPDAPDFYGWTVLMYAADAGHAVVIEALLEHGADPNVPVKRAERLFYLYNDVPRLDRGDEGATVLMYAAGRGHAQIVNVLLAHGAQPNARTARGHTVLMAAADGGSLEIVNALLAHGAEVDAGDKGVGALMAAVDGGSLEIVNVLLEQGADPNTPLEGDVPDGATLLMYAAASGMTQWVEALLEHGADVKAQDAEGKTALFYAVDEGHDEVAEILRNAGASEIQEVSRDPTAQPSYTLVELAGLAFRLNDVAERMDEVREPPPVEPGAEGRRDWDIARTLIFRTEEWDTRLEWLATAYYLSGLASEENPETAWYFYHTATRPVFDWMSEQMEREVR